MSKVSCERHKDSLAYNGWFPVWPTIGRDDLFLMTCLIYLQLSCCHFFQNVSVHYLCNRSIPSTGFDEWTRITEKTILSSNFQHTSLCEVLHRRAYMQIWLPKCIDNCKIQRNTHACIHKTFKHIDIHTIQRNVETHMRIHGYNRRWIHT